MTILHIITYLVFAFFLIMVIGRILRIANAPRHLRWELYPVPHEKGKAKYGGSRLEEVDWWTKSEKKSYLNEIKTMAEEIIFLKGVWEHNRELWFGSFPFHFGLYILIVNMLVLVFAGVIQLNGGSFSTDSTGINLFLYWIINILTLSGTLIGLIGSVRLLFTRIANKSLALYSTASHYFNIILIGAIYLTLLMWLLVDKGFVANLSGFYAGLISFSAYDKLPAIGYWSIWTSLIFIAYLPLTHMTHFFTKYFTYHHVRWEDEPNLPGSKIKEQVSKYLNMPVTWAASHIGADGNKNWIAIVTTNPFLEGKDGK